MSSSEGTQCMRVHFFRLVNQPRNGNFRTEQGLLRLLRTQPQRKYQSLVSNSSLLRKHQYSFWFRNHLYLQPTVKAWRQLEE